MLDDSKWTESGGILTDRGIECGFPSIRHCGSKISGAVFKWIEEQYGGIDILLQ